MRAIPPMERRILIVESQNDFALSMASVLKGAGYQTAMANSAADAQRELQKRRPDLVILRAELPDQSGFVLCGQIKKGRFGQALPVLLLSSDVGKDGLTEHSQGSGAADAYLSIPFEMTDLAAVTSQIVPLAASEANGAASQENSEAAVPPPMPAAPAGSPPKIPRRERRSAITEEDKGFLDRAFQSIADRKAELIAESHQLRRSTPRRELMSSPEGKIQVLREELKFRESQLARISEIWAARERELLSVEDRLHEKDVEVQGLKMQVDDLLRRFNDAQQSMLQKEKEHGATVDDLLLQKFATEKDLIEVVASKEKELNATKQELAFKNEELAGRQKEVEASGAERARLEQQISVATLDFEVKEQALNQQIEERSATLRELGENLEKTKAELVNTLSDRDQQLAKWEGNFKDVEERLRQTEEERAATVGSLEQRIREADEAGAQLRLEVESVNSERARVEAELRQQLSKLEAETAETREQRDEVRIEREQIERSLSERLAERDAKIAGIGQELAAQVQRQEQSEANLNQEIQQKLERIGELEGEVEASRVQLEDRERELEEERSSHAKSRAEAAEQIESLRSSGTATQQAADDLAAELSAAKQDLGARFAEATQLGSQLAQADDVRNALQEKLDTLIEETRRREEFLQNDLATRTLEVADLQQKLTSVTQEKQRHADSLARDAATKGEQLKQWEGKFRALEDEARKRLEESSRRGEALNHELASARAEIAELRKKLQAATEARAQAMAERDKLREAMGAQAKQSQAQLGQASQHLDRAKVEHDRLSEQLAQAEGKIAKLGHEHQSRTAEIDSRQKDFQNQLTSRARKIQELEAAVENLVAAKARLEKDGNVKATLAEGKAKELSAKLAAVLKERKELEARHAKELEDLASKHKSELERREQVKSQEVVRLQQAVQEKSKALKVVELELARYRSKPGAAPAKAAAPPAVARPAANSAPKPSAAAAKAAGPAKTEKSSVLPPGDDQEDWSALVDKLDK